MIITNIKALVGVTSAARVTGEQMAALPIIENAYLVTENGAIKEFGPMSEYHYERSDYDATGRYVMPSFCDSHTHLVYPCSREGEWVDRIKGLSYAEIAKRGGGILNTAKKLHTASEDELYEAAFERCQTIIGTGTGAVEIKSGYGLNTEDELKMLRVIRRLKESSPLTIKATLLAAHAVPAEYKGRQDDYVSLIVDEMLPMAAGEGLIDYIDSFCDEGFFTTTQTERMLNAAAKYGIRGKIHANELAVSGGVQIAVACGALSADHLEAMDEAAIEAFRGACTMPTLLPGAAFFLGIDYPPARRMIEAGLGVALASDFNPGSSPIGNMQMICSLAAIQMKMLPMEALAAATVNSAYAMGVNDTQGSIAVGKKANLIITKPMPSLEYMLYSYAENCVEKNLL